MRSGKVLIVDNDREEQDLVRNILRLDGLYTCTVDDGDQAIISMQREAPNVVLIDLGLPGIDGFEVCQLIRRSSHVPIIAVSSFNSLQERERFLSLGGDDYVTKPFSSEELRFRVLVALNKSHNAQLESTTFQFVDDYLKIDFETRIAKVSGNEVTFTSREYAVLSELVRNAGKPLPFKHLLKEAWGHEYETDKNILYLCISRIRNKIERDSPGHQYIITLPRFGYRFRISPQQHKPVDYDTDRKTPDIILSKSDFQKFERKMIGSQEGF